MLSQMITVTKVGCAMFLDLFPTVEYVVINEVTVMTIFQLDYHYCLWPSSSPPLFLGTLMC